MTSTLLPLLPAVYDILFDFAQSDGFWANLETAFGTSYDVVKATQLRQQWQSRDFSQLPPITVKNLGNSGIFGAYSSSTNRIYISQALIDSGDATTLSAVLLEEIGHFIDAQINSSDTPGDEGQLFSALVRGVNLTDAQLNAIKQEDDHSIITVDGQQVAIEMAFGTTGYIQFGSFMGDQATDITTDSSGNIYISGYTSASSVSRDVIVAKYDKSGNQLWFKTFGSSNILDEDGVGISTDSIGNVYVTGYTYLGSFPGNGNLGGADAFIAKYNASGSQTWVKQFGTSKDEYGFGISTDSIGNVYVTGSTYLGSFPGNSNLGGGDAFIAKYNASGSQIWIKQFGTSLSENASNITIDNTDNIYLSGTTQGSLPSNSNLGGEDAFIAKYNASGSQIWIKQFGTSDVDTLYDISTDNSGNVYVTGYTQGRFPGNSNFGSRDGFVAKYDVSGNQLWIKQFGTSGDDYGTGISTDNSGNVYVSGSTIGSLPGNSNLGSSDTFIAKYDGSGNQLWVKQFGTSDYDWADGMSYNTGNVYITGFTIGSLPGNSNLGGGDVFIAGFDANGNLLTNSITLSINDLTVTEGNSGTTNAVFTVSLSSAASTVVTVNYATANGTATAGTDYTAIPTTTLTFNPGETSKTITVAVNGDNQVELNETFLLNLSNLQANGSNVTLADNQGQGTINNDDNPNQSPTDLTLSNNTVAENQPINTLIGDFTTTDPDTGNTFTYSLVSGTGDTDNSLFSISANQLKTNATFDYETKNSYSIRVKTTDQGGLSYEKPLTVNITDVGATLVSNYDTRHATDLHIVGNYAYVANWTGGWYSILKIIDISNPTNPILKGNYTSIRIASDVQVVGNYAYVVSGDPATLQITDISNPANPTFKSAITFYQDVPNDVEVVGNLAYVACNVSGLHIIDISNPTNPIHKANYRTGDLYSGYALGVQVVNKYAYVAALDLGLQIIDISNPTAPTLKGNYDTPGIADDVQIVGNYAYVADRGSGLQIIDISNPSNPTLKGNYKTSYSAESVQVVDKYAYVAVGYLGLEIIDISNPANPTLKGNYDTDGWVSDVQVVGNYAYLADGDGGLKILDVSEFTTPVTSVTLAVSPSSVAEDGTTNLVYAFIRNGNTTNPLTVNYTVGGTATFNTDYTQSGAANFTSTTGTVTFAAGSSTATVTIDPTADTIVEADETVILTLISGTGYTLDAATTATGTINNDDSASIAISDVTVTEGNSGTTNAVFTVTLSNPVDTAITLNYATADGTATTADNDYIAIATTPLTFNAGETSKTITVAVNGDTKVESNETFFVNLSNLQTNGRNVTLADNQGQGTITNDDVILPSITLAVSPSSVTEDGTQNLIYTFTRSGVTTNLLTVNYSIGGTATNGTDYASIPTGVTFAANLATATVTINPTADTTVESDETVALTLTSGTGYTVGTTTAVTGTITNDDTSVTLAVSPASVTEDGTSNLVYTFTRSGVTSNALTVNYTLGGTATLNTDYTRSGTNNTVTFAANATTATVIVDPTADTTVENNETVALTLASGTGYTIGTPNAATGTITNDDTSVTLAVSPASVTENGTTNLIYTFTRTGVTTSALTANYTVGGTATFNTDYTQTGAASFTSTTGTVTFAANATKATVTVDPTADTTVESDETVVLTLATGTGYTIGTPTAVTGTINNDDTNVTLAVSPGSVTEDGTNNLVYTFTRTGVTTNALTVNYTLGGTATLNTDYTRTGTNNTVTFAANATTATVTVDPTADTTVESDETVALTLATGTGYTVGTTTAVTGTITNDDFSQLSINDIITVVEGKNSNAVLTVTVNNPNPQQISVNYATAPIDATPNVDYTSQTGTLIIPANASTATITIPILNDDLNEPDEVFAVTLSNATNAIINPDEETAGVIITDTWQSILTRTLPNGIENLKLIGTNNINGTGNNANNIITGNSGNNQINGANGADILTGGPGADTFIFQFGQSTISTSDRITDFAINSDKIDLLTQGGLPMSAPSSFSRAANSTVTTLDNLINQVFTDANGATTGNQGLGVNSAALVQVTTGAIAGTYLVINDSTAGFQSSNDLLINITGFTGTLPALGNIPVSNFFV
ncbi:Calx-beta domain-containing protein [Microcystis sp. LEGE 08355]|uniref:Calx-beta domain-containing protein n=1 Tax=Microcystis sp. LEGE 08355 TaxID=1828687 RepID=UPI0018807588|nr:Calx-beta domain-containing protein [Microcystis sp. LEGE 08355]MBE9073063.1 SBBP repeat-containing protein [Microcystis sp. LEGE 08355]